MGKVISLTAGRRRLGKALPKPRACDDCEEPIETARLQIDPKAKRCVSCQGSHERRRQRALSSLGENDVAIIRGR